MTIACIAIPHFSLRMTLLDRPDLDGLPLVLTSPPNSRTTVADCTPEASKRGVRPGMMLREVTSLCPEATFIEPNPVREAIALERIIEKLETFSPAVEPEGLERFYVDLDGLGRHDASPEDAADRLLSLVPPILRPRAGVAPGKFIASIAARRAKPGQSLIVSSRQVGDFLKPIPVAWLPIEFRTVRSLERLGLQTLGDLRELPLAAVQSRFGPTGKLIWNLANGIDDDTVHPREQPEIVTESLTLPAPTTSREMLLIGVRQLVQRAFDRPVLHHRNVRQARLQVIIEDHRSWEREMTFREPAGVERVVEILTHRLQDLELSGAAERLMLSLIGLTEETVHQEFLPGMKPRHLAPIAKATRQLKQRYGSSPLYHIAEVEPWSRIPERRHALISYDP